jgi:hypothetical protein
MMAHIAQQMDGLPAILLSLVSQLNIVDFDLLAQMAQQHSGFGPACM